MSSKSSTTSNISPKTSAILIEYFIDCIELINLQAVPQTDFAHATKCERSLLQLPDCSPGDAMDFLEKLVTPQASKAFCHSRVLTGVNTH